MTEMPDCYPETISTRKGCGCTEMIGTVTTRKEVGESFEFQTENPDEVQGDAKVHTAQPFILFKPVEEGLQVYDALRYYYTCLNCGQKMRHIRKIEGPKGFIHNDGRWTVKEERLSDRS